jgi:lycopene cyclase domain-containing protein
MSYTEITSLSLMIAVLSDIFIFKTSLLTTRAFWASYAIILPFQLLTNSWLTTREVVIYNSREIIGLRLAGAPIEDLLFGFAMVVGFLAYWEFRQRKQKVS